MYRKVLNYLRGQVTVEVESAAPERVLNLCAAHGVPFWELEWLSEDPAARLLPAEPRCRGGRRRWPRRTRR